MKAPIFFKVLGYALALLSAVSIIFWFGWYVGRFTQNIDFELEKSRLHQECAEKLQAQREQCRDEKLDCYKEEVSGLVKAVQSLSQEKK